jgi:hypothetical protein
VADITVTVSSPGILGFGQGEFGDQYFGGENLSAITSIGISEFINNTGWGANEWGLLGWGVNYQNSDASLTGSQLNISEGNVTAEGEVREGWGVYQWGIVAWGGEQDPEVNVIGSALEAATHPVDIQIDGNISVSVDEDDDITIAVGSPSIRTDVAFNVTGSRLNLTEGLNTVLITINVNVPVTGSQLNGSVGIITAGLLVEVPVTGSQVNTLIGNESISTDVSVTVTTAGRLNLSPGQITYAAGYNVTGSQANLSVGTVTFVITGSTTVTGSRLNVRQGSVNIQGWSEVQTGANNTWTPVDIAA